MQIFRFRSEYFINKITNVKKQYPKPFNYVQTNN